ncbi:hypothetical protein CAPTEDRAFT_190255 [Capitella teleta]|uniref:MULE transposase domain-containing protein n=1 Tax=Capitella teleta TaxID=283909 RepID=R7V4D1_CAPTE|nr:hypothetical protein CAPTEDRAFT_190255 [Capitella teleta]|eukprot:ELU13678.1 hypothetical protein CAPTEDRAFT_190255 [Capitella teleta]
MAVSTFSWSGRPHLGSVSFKSGCKAKIYAAVGKDTKRVEVKSMLTEHNHIIGPEVYALYPKQRLLTADETALIENLVKVNVSTKMARNHAEEQFNKKLHLQDIRNIRQRNKSTTVNGVRLNNAQLLIKALQAEKEKDPGMSIQALEKVFPNAFVELCYFHALDACRKKINSLSCSKAEKDSLKKLVVAINECRDEALFEELVRNLSDISAPFHSYFMENWYSIKEKWAAFARSQRVNFGDRTTNRIEGFHQKLKQEVPRFAPLDTMFKCILLVIRTLEHEIGFRRFFEALPGQTPSQVVVSENERARLPSKLNRTQKYSLARGTLDKICGRLVALGMDKFLSYLSLLQEFELAISERRDVNIIEVERAQPMNDYDDEVDEEVASERIEDETEVIVTHHGVEVFIRRDELETVVEEDDGEVLTVDSGSPGILALTVAGSADVEASGSACVSTDVVASTDIAESSAAVEESAVVEVLLPGEEPSDDQLVAPQAMDKQSLVFPAKEKMQQNRKRSASAKKHTSPILSKKHIPLILEFGKWTCMDRGTYNALLSAIKRNREAKEELCAMCQKPLAYHTQAITCDCCLYWHHLKCGLPDGYLPSQEQF